MKLKCVAIITALLLAGCTVSNEENKTESEVTIVEPKQEVSSSSTVSTSSTTVENSTTSSSTESEDSKEELSRYEKASQQLETIQNVKEDTSVLEEKLTGFITKIKEDNRVDSLNLPDYLMKKDLLFDIKEDIIERGYDIKKYTVVYSDSEDVWQVLMTLENKEGKVGYYTAHYNTFFKKFIFYYRDIEIDLDVFLKGE